MSFKKKNSKKNVRRGEDVMSIELLGKAVSPPPQHGAPLAPGGFEPLTRNGVRRLKKLMPVQLQQIAKAAQEVGHKAFARDLGLDEAEATAVANGVRLLAAWVVERDRAAAWSLFATKETSLAADAVLASLEKVAPLFDAKVLRDRSLGELYAALSSVIHGHDDAAKRAAATRAENKKSPPPTPGKAVA